MTILLICGILGLTHVLGALAGFGTGLLAVPLLLVFTDLASPQVVLLLAVVSLLQALMICYRNRQHLVVKEVLPLAIPALVTLPLGGVAAVHLPERILIWVLGIFLILGATLQWLRPIHLPAQPRWRHAAVGMMGGLVQGAWACGGAVMVTWMQWTTEEIAVFRARLAFLWSILNAALVPIMLVVAPPSADFTILIMWSLLIVLAATLLGEWLLRFVSRRQFHHLVCALILISGILILAGRG